MAETLFAPAFALWGSPVSWLELVAVVLSLAMVACNIREVHWGWPLAIVASLLYFAFFWHQRIYGAALLQLVFAAFGLWGWWQWLRGRRDDGSALRVALMSGRARVVALLAGALLWPAVAGILLTLTDTDVPWWDGFSTAWSLVGQWMLARKYLENWVVWILVDVAAVGLYAYKALWPTAALYLVFSAMCVAGIREWRRRLRAPRAAA